MPHHLDPAMRTSEVRPITNRSRRILTEQTVGRLHHLRWAAWTLPTSPNNAIRPARRTVSTRASGCSSMPATGSRESGAAAPSHRSQTQTGVRAFSKISIPAAASSIAGWCSGRSKGQACLGRRHVAEGAVGCVWRRTSCGARAPVSATLRAALDQMQFRLGHVCIHR